MASLLTTTRQKKKKMNRKRLSILVLLLLTMGRSLASDSTFVLSKEGFLSIVRSYHPVLKIAGLQVRRAAAEVQQARGAFDPKLSATLDQKTFDGKQYYSYFNPALSIPTWYGINVKAALEENIGNRLNPETTAGKTTYLGLEVPANGLLFDTRRAALRQAQNMQQLSESERRLMTNELLYDALAAYWNWVRDYEQYKIISTAVSVNEQRLQFVKTEFAQGNRPAIDTTETLAQLQNFYLLQNNARLAFQNSGLLLSNYLWLDNNRPFPWDERIRPDTTALLYQPDLPRLDSIMHDPLLQHPKLKALEFKSAFLQTERRLKAQYLMPKLNLSAGLLGPGYAVPDEINRPLAGKNYKIGMDFSLPLFMRQARGAYRAASFKVMELEQLQAQTELEIRNKIKSYYNEVLALQQQISIHTDALQNYRKLFQGERIRFEVGESTLFLLNSRENKVLESMQKLTELNAKWQKSYAALFAAAGLLQ